MESTSTPRITCPYLDSYISRNVMVVGKVAQLRGEQAVLDADGNITAHLNRDAHLSSGNAAQIIGKVNPDLSIRVLSSVDLGQGVDMGICNTVVESTPPSSGGAGRVTLVWPPRSPLPSSSQGQQSQPAGQPATGPPRPSVDEILQGLATVRLGDENTGRDNGSEGGGGRRANSSRVGSSGSSGSSSGDVYWSSAQQSFRALGGLNRDLGRAQVGGGPADSPRPGGASSDGGESSQEEHGRAGILEWLFGGIGRLMSRRVVITMRLDEGGRWRIARRRND
ncbi:hypothetical protein NKR23_g7955 [Pleurostoma richardsiae]|uniref:Uncharacterized protein n=1 Tax=Pleurostoma richardsiae TaxID=41990 RepID=A0AA38RAU3_9PEZI|nr:hypothetical protein NKR23_g7955 [Pleurostoma richardsiae]